MPISTMITMVLTAYVGTYILEFYRHSVIHKYIATMTYEEFRLSEVSILKWFPLLILPLAVLESIYLVTTPTKELQLAALTMIFLGLMLRVFAIYKLGWLWSQKMIFVKGADYSQRNFPTKAKMIEYLSRIIDGSGVCLLLGSLYSCGFYVVTMIYLLSSIVPFFKKMILEYQGMPRKLD